MELIGASALSNNRDFNYCPAPLLKSLRYNSYFFFYYFIQSYIKYSNVAARVVRRCLEENTKKEALKREEQFAKINQWANGKMVKQQ